MTVPPPPPAPVAVRLADRFIAEPSALGVLADLAIAVVVSAYLTAAGELDGSPARYWVGGLLAVAYVVLSLRAVDERIPRLWNR